MSARAARPILMVSSLPLAAPWNGADKNLARLLVMADHDRRFIVQTSGAEPWPAARVRAICTPAALMPTGRQKLRTLGFVARYARRASLVHLVASLGQPSRWSAPVLRRAVKLWGVPLVHTLPSVGDQPVSRHNFPGDINTVISAHTQARLAAAGVPNVVRLMPPVDAALLRPRRDPTELRAELQLGEQAVLYPAHYGPNSGIATALLALAALPPACADATLVLACRTSAGQHGPTEAAHVMAAAHELGIAARVRIVETVTDMPALIQACAVTALVPRLLASKMDLPLVILEALALGRPVVISDQPPMSEALLGAGGFAVPPENPAALAAALAALLGDADLRTKLAQSGQAAVISQCSPAAVVATYQQIYEHAWDYQRQSNLPLPPQLRNRQP